MILLTIINTVPIMTFGFKDYFTAKGGMGQKNIFDLLFAFFSRQFCGRGFIISRDYHMMICSPHSFHGIHY